MREKSKRIEVHDPFPHWANVMFLSWNALGFPIAVIGAYIRIYLETAPTVES
jgi:hypothetical protein